MARAHDGGPIPVRNGEPVPDQARQGNIGACGPVAAIRAWARLALRIQSGEVNPGTRVWSPDDAIRENDDGTVTVLLHEVRRYGGLSMPTGRMTEITMKTEDVVYANSDGLPAFLSLRYGNATWAGKVLEDLAGTDRIWPLRRLAQFARDMAARDVTQRTDVRGYARLDLGSTSTDHAEILARLTGVPAYHFQSRPGELAADWKRLTDAGNVVIGSTRPDLEGSPYGLISGNDRASGHEQASIDNGNKGNNEDQDIEDVPDKGHAYVVLKVVHGTLDEARREAARLRSFDRVRYDDSDVVRLYRWTPKPDGNTAPQDYVILDNPWSHTQPEPVPASEAERFLHNSAATLALPGGHAQATAGAGTPDQNAVPLFKGEPRPGEVPQRVYNDVSGVIRALVGADPGLIKAAITEDHGDVVLQVHETTFSPDGWSVEPTGRVFKVPMPKQLPAGPRDPSRSLLLVNEGAGSWPAHMEEGLAIAGEHLEPPDAAVPQDHSEYYWRLRAETLTRLTGKPSRIIVPDSGEEAAAAWKQLIDDGKPVLVGAKQSFQRPDARAYNVAGGRVFRVVAVEDDHVRFKA